MGDHGEPSGPDPLKAWREVWLRADYSWDGLLDHERETEGFKSLQGYWRANPETGAWRSDHELKALGELIAVKGQETYHLAHLPLHYADGTPTLKTTAPGKIQDQLGTLLRARLTAAAPQDEDEPPKPPAALQGVVFLNADYSKRNFGPVVKAAFRHCLFSKGANFSSAVFSEDTDFESTAFSGRANFTSAAFSGNAVFRSAAFSWVADFTSAAFSEDADFESTAFSGRANFTSAAFSGNAVFRSAAFSWVADFTSAAFSEDADFESAVFSGSIYFTGAAFSGNAVFSSAIFPVFAFFGSAAFSGVALFYGVTFSNADFTSVTFSGNVDFGKATFYGSASFNGSKFCWNANFRNAAFFKGAHFESTAFSGDADFYRSQFEKISRSFYLTTFSASADFRHLEWPESPSQWRQAFYATRFKSFAIFEHFGLKAFAAFDGAKFESDLRIDKVSDAEARKAFDAELRAATGDDDALRQIEGGCRVLKQAMEKAADKSREQLLYRFELIARRKQKATPWPEKALSLAYSQFSDYGASYWRPFRGLLLLCAGFALLYAPMTYVIDAKPKPFASAQAKITWEIDSDRIAQVLTVSASRMFPFGAYDEVSKDFAKNLSNHNIWLAFGYRFLATVQSFLSLTMAFLFALAVRRRFQIS